jgi:hypothetical protein
MPRSSQVGEISAVKFKSFSTCVESFLSRDECQAGAHARDLFQELNLNENNGDASFCVAANTDSDGPPTRQFVSSPY